MFISSILFAFQQFLLDFPRGFWLIAFFYFEKSQKDLVERLKEDDEEDEEEKEDDKDEEKNKKLMTNPARN